MFVQKFGHHICPEREGDTAVVLSPAEDVFVWVGPQQVAQQTLVRHVCGSHYSADLLHGLEIRREAWRHGERERTSMLVCYLKFTLQDVFSCYSLFYLLLCCKLRFYFYFMSYYGFLAFNYVLMFLFFYYTFVLFPTLNVKSSVFLL